MERRECESEAHVIVPNCVKEELMYDAEIKPLPPTNLLIICGCVQILYTGEISGAPTEPESMNFGLAILDSGLPELIASGWFKPSISLS